MPLRPTCRVTLDHSSRLKRMKKRWQHFFKLFSFPPSNFPIFRCDFYPGKFFRYELWNVKCLELSDTSNTAWWGPTLLLLWSLLVSSLDCSLNFSLNTINYSINEELVAEYLFALRINAFGKSERKKKKFWNIYSRSSGSFKFTN